jgi:pantoate--beta-alanine ligase
MELIEKIDHLQQRAETLRRSGTKIGVVPTMGFLHEGHQSLIRLAKTRCDVVITTIFVNPTQFAPSEDLANYPRNLARDRQLAEAAGSAIVFHPAPSEMYPPNYATWVTVDELTQMLCGASRPTHFRGVTTIVAKLFNITQPHVAVFGQKDAQQALVIRRMVRDLNFALEIVIAPIVREPDGLAMSSRNVYLTAAEREQAVVLSQALNTARQMLALGERRPERILQAIQRQIREKPLAEIDYTAVVSTENLLPVTPLSGEILIALAVKFGKARLIDNLIVRVDGTDFLSK